MTQKSKFYEHVHTVSHKMVQCIVQFLAKRSKQEDGPFAEYTVAMDNQNLVSQTHSFSFNYPHSLLLF